MNPEVSRGGNTCGIRLPTCEEYVTTVADSRIRGTELDETRVDAGNSGRATQKQTKAARSGRHWSWTKRESTQATATETRRGRRRRWKTDDTSRTGHEAVEPSSRGRHQPRRSGVRAERGGKSAGAEQTGGHPCSRRRRRRSHIYLQTK